MRTFKEYKFKKCTITFTAMNHWGHFVILPSVTLSINYSLPKLMFEWMIFRIDISFYRYLPDWFMDYVWSVMNFDFLFKKEDDEEE